MNTTPQRDEERVLELLQAVERRSDVTQRHLARQMGVALGLANSYLKRCIRKGLIKISEAPANRYLYYLTPKGFSEKSRLTAKYLAASFAFYRSAGESCARALKECEARGQQRVLLCGVSDLAEVAALRALEMDIDIVGVFDPRTERRRFLGKPVWRNLSEALPFDVCLLTDTQADRGVYEQLLQTFGNNGVKVPDILRL
ncbi:transcriptional regulator, MarR family protein [Sulfurifustis variabilis]|uniref:Transcriptional regulator, MarR family protein n=1 Tax=Sulfurifustis variabilis TaxID=1675686 RepID=A0A1B4V500_9GAMM|nr:winged helix-turn-helix transcriptional regulator [Sulfurifustis variabilis]BAU48613.1 transcriptional regulator, MarR family protein [Sulfurifustis variabilis]